jgi:hypothetical protein
MLMLLVDRENRAVPSRQISVNDRVIYGPHAAVSMGGRTICLLETHVQSILE